MSSLEKRVFRPFAHDSYNFNFKSFTFPLFTGKRARKEESDLRSTAVSQPLLGALFLFVSRLFCGDPHVEGERAERHRSIVRLANASAV